jgi:hypothetical protein
MVMVDGDGKRLEVIVLDRGHGPETWIRVSWRNQILVGAGYYRTVDEALEHVDVETLVEAIPHPAPRPLATHRTRRLNQCRRAAHIPHTHNLSGPQTSRAARQTRARLVPR